MFVSGVDNIDLNFPLQLDTESIVAIQQEPELRDQDPQWNNMNHFCIPA